MKRLRVLFAIVLISLFFPCWRFLDYISLLAPTPFISATFLAISVLIFVIVPIKILIPKIHNAWVAISFMSLGAISLWLGPVSKMATSDDRFNHCSILTYTGFFYPLSPILSDSFQDDLEVRNQLCWLKKMILRIPNNFENVHELQNYLHISDKKLIAPKNKFRISLPLIAILNGLILARWEESSNKVKVQSAAIFFDKMEFWSNHYTLEIHQRQYSWIDWPFGPYIQFEYGFIEKNWEKISEYLKIRQ